MNTLPEQKFEVPNIKVTKGGGLLYIIQGDLTSINFAPNGTSNVHGTFPDGRVDRGFPLPPREVDIRRGHENR